MSNETTPPKKKLPFKPTALWKAAQPTPKPSGETKDDGFDSIFRRSGDMAAIIAADQERRLKKMRRREEKREQRRLSAGKKRSLDDEEEEDLYGVEPEYDSSPKNVPTQADAGDNHVPADESGTVVGDSFRYMTHSRCPIAFELTDSRELATPPPSKRSRRGSASSKKVASFLEEGESAVEESPSARRLTSASKAEAQGHGPDNHYGAPSKSRSAILLDSDSEEDIAKPPKRRDSSVEILDTYPNDSVDTNVQDEEDDEFAEYVRQAEAQRDQQLAMQTSGGSGGTGAKETVEIFITSEIPDAKSFIARFTFDKALRVVRDSWLATQVKKGVQLPLDEHQGALLTWRRKRVYNSSTLLDLGIRPQGNGRAMVDGHSREGLKKNATRVHMEGWTPKLFAEMEHEAEQTRKREAGELSEEEEEVEAQPRIRVTLRARDLGDVRLTGLPETTVETLLTAYRQQCAAVAKKHLSLRFDGETLEEHVTLADAEIEDLDTIEVHIK